jgi:hypothetical protein
MAIQHALAAVILGAMLGAVSLSEEQFPDLHGGSDSLAAHRGEPLVVVVVDARHLGTVRRWAEDLYTRYPKLQLLMVADVNEQRPTTQARVAEVLSRRVPPEARVLIDMNRLWAREFGLDTAAPNLFLFDANGEVVGRFRGRWNEELSAEVALAVAAMGVSA